MQRLLAFKREKERKIVKTNTEKQRILRPCIETNSTKQWRLFILGLVANKWGTLKSAQNAKCTINGCRPSFGPIVFLCSIDPGCTNKYLPTNLFRTGPSEDCVWDRRRSVVMITIIMQAMSLRVGSTAAQSSPLWSLHGFRRIVTRDGNFENRSSWQRKKFRKTSRSSLVRFFLCILLAVKTITDEDGKRQADFRRTPGFAQALVDTILAGNEHGEHWIKTSLWHL